MNRNVNPTFFYFGDSHTFACTCFFFIYCFWALRMSISPLCRKCFQFWPNSLFLRRMASLSVRYLTNSLATQEMIDQFGMKGKEAQQDPCSVPELWKRYFTAFSTNRAQPFLNSREQTWNPVVDFSKATSRKVRPKVVLFKYKRTNFGRTFLEVQLRKIQHRNRLRNTKACTV